MTLEYQRKVAKDLQEYFKKKKLEEADQGPFFGFLPKNEISNGRYVCPPSHEPNTSKFQASANRDTSMSRL